MDLIYDEDSPYYFDPDLTDEYLDELDRLFDRICQNPNDRESIIDAKISDVDARLPDREPAYDQDKMEEYTELVKYIATLEVLLDLVEIGYHIEKDPENIDRDPPVKVYPPDPGRYDDDPQKYKELEREILQKERRAQFDETTREFIREMEEPIRHHGRSIDVTDLIADGPELYEDLSKLQSLDREEIIDHLDEEIQPYIQVAEKGKTDVQTGLDLHDIWRYFRYTWLTPYNTVPGRNINFLIRDASREHHPVMGIASLASSMMNLKQRDKYVGWRMDAVEETLDRRFQEHEIEHQLPKEERTPDNKTTTKTVKEYLETEEEHEERVEEYCSFIRSTVENAIDESIGEIRYEDFINRFDDLDKSDFENATETAFTRLKQIEGLATYVFKGEPPLTTEVENPDDYDNIFDPEEFELDPEDLDDIDIEDTDPDRIEISTLDTFGVQKRELEELVVKTPETDDEEEESESLAERINEAYPESVRLDDFTELEINVAETNLETFGPIALSEFDDDVVRLGSHVKYRLQSETALYVKKRAHTLQKLLRDRQYFLEHADQDDDKAFIDNALESDEGYRALQTAIKEVKKKRVGAGMMNIQVCGAIPPYNHILGGKLVAMALTGPKVIDIYRDKYEGYESKIASAMKGAPVVKENELVFLDTTGLFKVGSAQYDRVRVPAPKGQIEFEEIGSTEGYGSVQFGAETRRRLSEVTELLEDRQAVRGRFGEGIAPKMRKIRHGLENLELDGDLLKHESPRVIYAVDLADDFREYLFGLTDDPDYYWPFDDVGEEQQLIYDHWKQRWVSKRIQKEEILERIDQFDKLKNLSLGREIDFENHSLRDFL